MRYIIVDVEATCWEKPFNKDDIEIIEIGAVEMASLSGPIVREFQIFVRPMHHPVLSQFCRQLTGISQLDIDHANNFAFAMFKFMNWIGQEPFIWGAWGRFDYDCFMRDARRHHIDLPDNFQRFVDIKHLYAKKRNTKPLQMISALAYEGHDLAGTHHRALCDAHNIAKIMNCLYKVGATI